MPKCESTGDCCGDECGNMISIEESVPIDDVQALIDALECHGYFVIKKGFNMAEMKNARL